MVGGGPDDSVTAKLYMTREEAVEIMIFILKRRRS